MTPEPRQLRNVLPLSGVLVAAACNNAVAPPTTPDPDPDQVLTSIEMRPAQRTFGIFGQAIRINALQVGDDGEYMLAGDGTVVSSGRRPSSFAWSSDDPDVATVDDRGVVAAVGEGTASVTATSDGIRGTTEITVADEARLAWSIPIGPLPNAGITIGDDGTVFFATHDGLAAVDPAGSIRWMIPRAGGVQSAPAIAEDGTVYFGSLPFPGNDVSLTAAEADGDILWELTSLGSVTASPALHGDGTIYFLANTADTGTLYAVSPAGSQQWTYQVSDRFLFSSPAIAEDGTAYFGGMSGRLYAVSPDGTERWTFSTGSTIADAPVIGADGTIYVGAEDGRVYAVNPDGTERWSSEVGRQVYSAPSIGPDGTIYVGAHGLRAISPGGSLLWSVGEGTVGSTPIVGADGTIYHGSSDGRLYARNPDGSLRWDYATGGPLAASPAIGLDGRIFVASYDSTAYAIEELNSTNGGFEGAPWPTAGGNRGNTGRANGP